MVQDKSVISARGSSLMLLTTAMIWGFAFVAQRQGMEHYGPLIFNGIRFLLGALVLLPFGLKILLNDKNVLLPGLMMGFVLVFAAGFQQVGVVYTTAGNAGFITGLYILFVPLFGLLIRQTVPIIIWPASMIAIAGLYLLSVGDSFEISNGDLLVLISSVFWAIHVLMVGKFVQNHSPLSLAIIQFLVCGVISLASALIIENNTFESLVTGWGPILYAGVLSAGLAYTLQLFGQKRARPALAAIILSSEAVFAVIGGWIILNEELTYRQIAGCALMMIGILLAQIGPAIRLKLIRNNAENFDSGNLNKQKKVQNA